MRGRGVGKRLLATKKNCKPPLYRPELHVCTVAGEIMVILFKRKRNTAKPKQGRFFSSLLRDVGDHESMRMLFGEDHPMWNLSPIALYMMRFPSLPQSAKTYPNCGLMGVYCKHSCSSTEKNGRSTKPTETLVLKYFSKSSS